MFDEALLDGKLTEARKRWLVGLVTHEMVADPLDLMPLRMRYIEVLAESALNEDAALIEETLFADTYYFTEMTSDEEMAEVVLFCLALASNLGSAKCMVALGGFYYWGQCGVKQDRKEAESLYAAATELGSLPAAVCLGYCHESVGNFERAFHCFARAAFLGDDPEALYKVGDFYRKGRYVACDENLAMELYRRSYDLAEKAGGASQAAQASFRMAEMMQDIPLPSDEHLLGMLDMYMEAEIGMRRDIAAGATYYRSRLELCVKRQAEIRTTIENRYRDGVAFSMFDK